ncbi:MAG: ABC transporter permease [Thermomicrobiales bacterium]
MMAELAGSRVDPVTIDLPGEPARIALDVAFEVDPLPSDVEIPPDVRPARLELQAEMRVALVDANGQIFRVELGEANQTGEAGRVAGDLTYVAEDGSRLLPNYPLRLLTMEMRTPAPQDIPRTARLRIESILISPDFDGDAWQPVSTDLDPGSWDITVTDLALARDRPALTPNPGAEAPGLSLEIFSGSTTSEAAIPIIIGFRPAGSPTIESLPVLVSTELMEQGGLEVGDQMPLPSLPGYDGSGTIVGTLEEFPTVEPERGEPVVVDYQTYLLASFDPGIVIQRPDEYWLTVDPDSVDETIEQLIAAPLASADVMSQEERETTLQSDPVALGTIGSLMIGFIAAAIFAGIGFAVNAAVSARERLVEFALMRAVGLSNRQLMAWLGLENALLVLFGLIGGTLLGIALAWAVLPLIAITQEATEAVPGVIVVYPWQTILWLELSMIAVLILAVGLLAIMLRRMGLGALLRLGEE